MLWDTASDWLVKQLTERCKEGMIVDGADLSFIISLNVDGYVAPATYNYHDFTYGHAIQELGRVVAAKAGKLVVPVLDDYSRVEVLQAPSDWLQLWGREKTVPSTYTLWAEFDIVTALAPDGRSMMVDGPGAHSLEAWLRYCRERDAVLERRRLRRVAGGR